MVIPGTSLQAFYVEELQPVADPATELVGALFEVTTQTGPNGGWESKKLTSEQLTDFLSSFIGGSPGGGGAAATRAASFDVTQAGENTFQLPTTATGYTQVQVQTPNPQPSGAAPVDGETDPVNAIHVSFNTATQQLTVSEDAGLKVGQTVTITYLYGSAAVGSSGPIEFSDIGGVADPSQLPVADAAYIQQMYAALKPFINQDFVPR